MLPKETCQTCHWDFSHNLETSFPCFLIRALNSSSCCLKWLSIFSIVSSGKQRQNLTCKPKEICIQTETEDQRHVGEWPKMFQLLVRKRSVGILSSLRKEISVKWNFVVFLQTVAHPLKVRRYKFSYPLHPSVGPCIPSEPSCIPPETCLAPAHPAAEVSPKSPEWCAPLLGRWCANSKWFCHWWLLEICLDLTHNSEQLPATT